MTRAISQPGVGAAMMTVASATDALALATYLSQVGVPNLCKGAGVFMDKLLAHKVASLREAIEAQVCRKSNPPATFRAAAVCLLYLYPYLPDFNLKGNCWSKVKEFLRSKSACTESY